MFFKENADIFSEIQVKQHIYIRVNQIGCEGNSLKASEFKFGIRLHLLAFPERPRF